MVIEYFLKWVETAPANKRADAAAALIKAFLHRDLPSEVREDTEAAITTLLEDRAPDVRIALAEAFGAFPVAPRHIILTLANDILDISIVVLSQSPVLHDAELIGFLKHGHEKQQIAVACRPWMSGRVTEAVALEAGRNACFAVLCNDAANFTDQSLHVLAQRFGDDTEIRNLLNSREDLPAETRVLLIERMGAQLAEFVGDRDWSSATETETVVTEACDRASIIFAANASESDVRRIVKARIDDGKLTVAYLIRAVCMGNISLVAHAFSELSGVRLDRVEAVLTRGRTSAFRAIYDRACLPGAAFKVFDIAINTWRDLLKSKSEINRSRLPFLVTKEVLAECHGGASEMVDDLLVLLRRLSAEAARENAKSKAMEISNRGKEIQGPLLEFDGVQDAEIITDHRETETKMVAGSVEIEAQELELENSRLEAANNQSAPTASATISPEAGSMGGLTDDDFAELYAGVELDEPLDEMLAFSKAA